MLKCWSYRPEERPTFRYCLEVLQLLRNNCEAVHINMQNSNRTLINGENIILLCKKHLYSLIHYSLPYRTTLRFFINICPKNQLFSNLLTKKNVSYLNSKNAS